MADINLTQQDWVIRLYIYEVMVKTGRSPSYQDIAQHFQIMTEEACLALHRLDSAHALYLRPDTDEVLMAFPLSNVETDYQVLVDDVTLYANCAWDSLGIPAMLNQDAKITLKHPITREVFTYEVKEGKLVSGEGGYVHYTLPFARWYDDLVDT